MVNNIKAFIDKFLTPEYLKDEAMSLFYEYFEEEDLEDGEEYVACINRYEAEEIPGAIIMQLGDELMSRFGVEPYCGTQLSKEVNDEITSHILTKIRVVYPLHGMYHEAEQARLKKQKDLFDSLN